MDRSPRLLIHIIDLTPPFVLRAMGYMTEQQTLTSKKQTVTTHFWVNYLLILFCTNSTFL